MLLIGTFLFPIIAGSLASVIKTDMNRRKQLYAVILLLTDVLVILCMRYAVPVTCFSFAENVPVTFSLDNLGRFFLTAVMILYSAVCIYAFEYMEMEERPHVFFAFYFVSFGMMIAVCMAGNPATMYMCFEMVTLSTMPLVLHELSREAVAAGMKYLFYSIAGALMGLFAVFILYAFSTDASFVMGGFLTPSLTAGHEKLLLAAVMVGIFGFGTKAGMYPMHGWLPTAHPIAPAPASALLSGIVAKAGVLALIRLVYYSVGAETIRGTWVQYIWMSFALLTIFMGSMMAYREKVLKKRLAYSTISQISYILLGMSFLSESGLQGALLHVLNHVASKGCLFLVAGVFIYKLGIRKVQDLKGIGKRMPVTLWCFTIAALSLVGIPPMGGFLSKWVIACAAIDSNVMPFAILGPVVLLISALLTAGYLLPVVVDGFFPGKDAEVPSQKDEPSPLMTVPMIFLCGVALAAGLFGFRILHFFGF